MKMIQRLIILLCVLGLSACGDARKDLQEPYQGQTLPFQMKDVVGWRYDLISTDHTFSIRFAEGGMAPTIIGTKKAIAAPLYQWHIDENDCLVLSNHDGLMGVYQLVSLNREKITVWDKIKRQAMEFTRMDTD